MASQLSVPAVALPHGLEIGKFLRDQSFPICRPVSDSSRFMLYRTTEQMNVIGHDDITPDHPLPGGFPCVEDGFVNVWIGQDFTAVVRADREKNDGGSVVLFNWRMVCRMFAVRIWRDDVLIVREQRGRCPSSLGH